ncbi:MAG: GmrSD restriction endonuclease domain-containing protein [Campylobacter sp.]
MDSTILNQESENYNIVDGQQRLTTLTILLNLLEQISILSLLIASQTMLYNATKFNKAAIEFGSQNSGKFLLNQDLLSKNTFLLNSSLSKPLL